MKIDFTKQEYQALVEMLLIADWMLRGHEVESPDATDPYDGGGWPKQPEIRSRTCTCTP